MTPRNTLQISPTLVEKNFHMILPFDEDLSSLFKLVPLTQHVGSSLVHLNPAVHTSGVHPGGDIDGVPPDVVIQFGGANYTARDVSVIESDPQD